MAEYQNSEWERIKYERCVFEICEAPEVIPSIENIATYPRLSQCLYVKLATGNQNRGYNRRCKTNN